MAQVETPQRPRRIMPLCCVCSKGKVVLRRPRDGSRLCKECFFTVFEEEVHRTITDAKLFTRGERIAIAASGGKDSTVLAHVLCKLNKNKDYGLDLVLLSIDEGIAGYRDTSLDCVKRNRDEYGLPLKVVSYSELYGWSMDQIVAEIGKKNNCTFCGVFRRQALDRGAALIGASKIATGHNADDIAETVIMNLFRGDIARLGRCTSIITGGQGSMARCKPLKYASEKEIVLYAHHAKLDYHSTECSYSPNAYRGFAREFLKDLESVRPTIALDIIASAKGWAVQESSDTEAFLAQAGGTDGMLQGCGGDNPIQASTMEPQYSVGGNGSKADDVKSYASISSRISTSGGSVTRLRSSGARELATVTRVLGNCTKCGYITSGALCQACMLLAGLASGQPLVALSGKGEDRVKLITKELIGSQLGTVHEDEEADEEMDEEMVKKQEEARRRKEKDELRRKMPIPVQIDLQDEAPPPNPLFLEVPGEPQAPRGCANCSCSNSSSATVSQSCSGAS